MRKSLQIVNLEHNVLVLDNEVFDWEDDLTTLKELVAHDPELKPKLLNMYQTGFCNAFAEFAGKSMTLAEITKAVEDGYVDC